MYASGKLSKNDVPCLVGLVLTGLFLFLIYIWAMPLIDPDEPRYASTARDMVVNGNWIVPHFNGVPRINKPPLFYWTVALSYKIFGINEFSSRLPSVLAAIGTAVITYAWRKRYRGKFQDRPTKNGFWAGMILMTSPLFYFIARFCITDMLLTFFVSATMYVFFVEYTEYTSVGSTHRGGFQTRPCKRMLLYFLLAMVFLVKGHVGILLFVLVTVCFLLLMRDFRYIRRLWYLPGFLLFLGIICAWGIPFWFSLGTQQIASLLSQETSGRFVSGYAHPEPFYYYLSVLIMGFFPLSPFLFLVFAYIIKRKNSMPVEEKRYLYFFSVWFVLTLIFFSLSRSKLMTYILPLSPSVALLISSLSQGETEEGGLGKWIIRVIWFILTVAMLIPVVLLATMHKWIPAKYGFSTGHVAVPLSIFFMGTLAALFAFFRERRFFPLQKVFCFTNGIFLTITLVYSSHSLGMFRSAKDLVIKCLSDKTVDYTLLNYSRIDPSLIFYSGKNVREVDKDSPGEEFLPKSNEPIYLVMSLRDYTKEKNWTQAMDFHVDCQNNTHVVLIK